MIYFFLTDIDSIILEGLGYSGVKEIPLEYIGNAYMKSMQFESKTKTFSHSSKLIKRPYVTLVGVMCDGTRHSLADAVKKEIASLKQLSKVKSHYEARYIYQKRKAELSFRMGLLHQVLDHLFDSSEYGLFTKVLKPTEKRYLLEIMRLMIISGDVPSQAKA